MLKTILPSWVEWQNTRIVPTCVHCLWLETTSLQQAGSTPLINISLTLARSPSWSVFTPKRGMAVKVKLELCISFFTPLICDIGRFFFSLSFSLEIGEGISTSCCLSREGKEHTCVEVKWPKTCPLGASKYLWSLLRGSQNKKMNNIYSVL